mmetsp:Transcript_9072/g.17088  ORF Transcript_9072/g.17088 Transcript_9072/m.17088 type:complete len:99 (-) Transcript_9072:525-821(-)
MSLTCSSCVHCRVISLLLHNAMGVFPLFATTGLEAALLVELTKPKAPRSFFPETVAVAVHVFFAILMAILRIFYLPRQGLVAGESQAPASPDVLENRN